jgi:serine/threonine-protein kinase
MIPAPNEVIAGKYRVEAQVGEGGMAVVLAATHEALRQRVAIKIVQPQYVSSNELRERFFREARALAALRSPHVARIFDVGTLENGATYLVLEYLEGLDLHRLLQRDGPLSPKDAAKYVREAAEGLAEAHQLGILHRDLKPSNLFLSPLPNGEPCVKILDFGLAKLTEEGITGLTEREDVMGSPSYMAPEQIRGLAQADARSDVWSLGVTLYELLTDALPFEGANATKTAAAVLTEPPADLAKRRPGLPSELVRIVSECLVKEADRRMASAGALAERLRKFEKSAAATPPAEPRLLAGLAEPSRPKGSGRGSGRGRSAERRGSEATYGGMLPLAPLDGSDDATQVMAPPLPPSTDAAPTYDGDTHVMDERTVEEATLVKLPPMAHDESEDQTVLRPRSPEPPPAPATDAVRPASIAPTFGAPPRPLPSAFPPPPAAPADLAVAPAKIDWKVPIAVGLAVAIGVFLIGLVAIRLR